MSAADTTPSEASGSSPWLMVATSLAPLPMLGLIGLTWLSRRPELGLGLAGVFLVWFGILFARWRRSFAPHAWSALPLLVFWAALVPVLESLMRAGGRLPVVGLAEFAPVVAGLVVGHLLLLGLVLRPGPTARALPFLAAAWIAGAWLLSTGLQVLRFELFLEGGFPEDTAYLWDCFRSWQAGGAIASEWSLDVRHAEPLPFFSMHFSPVVLPVFGIVRLRPDLSTLLIVQSVLVGLGILLWGWVMHRWSSRSSGDSPPASGGASSVGWLAIAALLITHPGVGAALRNELHPILWAIGPLAMLHHAWLWRQRWRFGLWALSLLLFREDLGLGVAAYALLSWVDGRRSGPDRFWCWMPLLGVVGSAAVIGGIMPRFGSAGGAFFQFAFDTTASGWVGFGIWLIAHPGELLARVFRPGHLILAAQLIATGLALPLRSRQWFPALPYIAVYSVLSRRLDLIRLGTHYVVLPALYLAIATVDSANQTMRGWRPDRRLAAGVMVWTLCVVQPVNVVLPPLGRLTDLAAYRSELREDLALIDGVDRAFVPVFFLSGTSAARAMPLHPWALQYADRYPDRAPRAALLPAEDPSLIGNWHHLESRYEVGPPLRVGTHYSLYPLK